FTLVEKEGETDPAVRKEAAAFLVEHFDKVTVTNRAITALAGTVIGKAKLTDAMEGGDTTLAMQVFSVGGSIPDAAKSDLIKAASSALGDNIKNIIPALAKEEAEGKPVVTDVQVGADGKVAVTMNIDGKSKTFMVDAEQFTQVMGEQAVPVVSPVPMQLAAVDTSPKAIAARSEMRNKASQPDGALAGDRRAACKTAPCVAAVEKLAGTPKEERSTGATTEIARNEAGSAVTCSNCISVTVLGLVNAKGGDAKLARQFLTEGIKMLKDLNGEDGNSAFAQSGGKELLAMFEEASAMLTKYENKQMTIGELAAEMDAAVDKCANSDKPLVGEVLNAVVDSIVSSDMLSKPEFAVVKVMAMDEIIASWVESSQKPGSDFELVEADIGTLGRLNDSTKPSVVGVFVSAEIANGNAEGLDIIGGMHDSLSGFDAAASSDLFAELGAAVTRMGDIKQIKPAADMAVSMMENAFVESDLGNNMENACRATRVLIKAGSIEAFEAIGSALKTDNVNMREIAAEAVLDNAGMIAESLEGAPEELKALASDILVMAVNIIADSGTMDLNSSVAVESADALMDLAGDELAAIAADPEQPESSRLDVCGFIAANSEHAKDETVVAAGSALSEIAISGSVEGAKEAMASIAKAVTSSDSRMRDSAGIAVSDIIASKATSADIKVSAFKFFAVNSADFTKDTRL
ncbi:hypothetical protein ACFL42_05265, partial [Candidatus Omnitrophota bacterium]